MAARELQDIADAGLRARMALPQRKADAGVLVLPSAVGLGATVNRVLAELAGAGLAALAWDPFSAYDTVLTQEQKSRITETEQADEAVLREHVFWLDHLHDRLGARNVATLGFCMGGRMSLHLAAKDARVKAAVAFYPTLRDPRPENMVDLVPLAGGISCPVLVHYPGQDHLTSRASFGQLRASLESRPGSAPTTVFFHPHARHGFMNQDQANGSPDAAATALAWPPTVAYLRTVLGTGATGADAR
jgi:carboxymethylenebutenolidase